MATRTVPLDTVKFLTAMGRALGVSVNVRTRPGRPPKPRELADAFTEATVAAPDQPRRRRRRKLRADPNSFRRRLVKANTEQEALAVIREIRSAPRYRKQHPKWDETTLRRYLPPHLKNIDVGAA